MSQSFKYISKLHNQRILVLGGTSGIGFRVAEAAVEHGAEVVVSGFSTTKLSAAINRLQGVKSPFLAPGTPVQVSGITCDLARPEDLELNLEQLLNFATADASRLLDHIVFTAGDSLKIVKLPDASIDAIHKANMVRVVAPTILAKLLPKFVKPSVSSSLTLTSGVSQLKPPPGWAIMVAAGAAVEGLTRGLAVDLSPVRVNAVSPGAVHTELFKDIPQDRLQSVLDQFKEESVTKTVGTPEEVAEAYIYCMKTDFMTGSVVTSDGGRLLK